MQRVFEIDVLVCGHCGGRRRVRKERVGVILPVAPEAGPFHKSGLDGVRYLVRSVRGSTRLKGNGLHAVGIGDGASSAFAAVKQWPHQFA